MSDEPGSAPESPPPAPHHPDTSTGQGEENILPAPSDGGGATANPEGELQAIRAELAAAQSERDAARAAIQEAQTEAATRMTELQAAAERAAAAHLESHRRALLAENRGQIVDELVAGDTPEVLTSSVEVARAAYARIVEAARVQAAAGVPAGASPQSEPDVESMTPLQKITGALKGAKEWH